MCVVALYLMIFVISCIQLFEGMKAYRTDDNRIVMFRPMENMKRMERTAERASLPVCIKFRSILSAILRSS